MEFLLGKNGNKPLFYSPNFIFTLLNDVSLIEAGYFDGYKKNEKDTLVSKLSEMTSVEKQNLADEINKKRAKIEDTFTMGYIGKLFEKRFLEFARFDFGAIKKMIDNEIANGDAVIAYLFYCGIYNALCDYKSFKNRSMVEFSVEVEMASVLQILDLTLTKSTFDEIVEIIYGYLLQLNGHLEEKTDEGSTKLQSEKDFYNRYVYAPSKRDGNERFKEDVDNLRKEIFDGLHEGDSFIAPGFFDIMVIKKVEGFNKKNGNIDFIASNDKAYGIDALYLMDENQDKRFRNMLSAGRKTGVINGYVDAYSKYGEPSITHA